MRDLVARPSFTMAAMLVYLFLLITSLHLEVAFLRLIRIENLLLAAIGLGGLSLFFSKKMTFQAEDYLPIFFLVALLFTVFFSSVLNYDNLQVLRDGEFLSLVKVTFVLPFLCYFSRRVENRKLLLNSLTLFYGILGLIFLFRFVILNEVREYDGRPTLQIRNGDPNFLCTFFAMTVPFALAQSEKYFSEKKALQFLGMLSVAFLLMGCALLTKSRMGFISLIMGLGLLLFLHPALKTKGKLLISFLAVFILGFVFYQSDFFLRFQQLFDKSNIDRYQTYLNSVKIFLDAPLFGVGMHQSANYFYNHTNYPLFQSEVRPLTIHNSFLAVLAELGAVGLILLWGLFSWSFTNILKFRNWMQPYLIAGWSIVLLASLSVNIAYKDLIYIHLFLLGEVSNSNEKEIL